MCMYECVYECVCLCVCVCVCSLFNGISTFIGCLMPNPSLLKNSCGTI